MNGMDDEAVGAVAFWPKRPQIAVRRRTPDLPAGLDRTESMVDVE